MPPPLPEDAEELSSEDDAGPFILSEGGTPVKSTSGPAITPRIAGSCDFLPRIPKNPEGPFFPRIP